MAIITFLVSAIKFGMVLLFGSTGETITEKSGHLNLGLPGVMCVGTAFGCAAEAIYSKLVGGYPNMTYILAILIPVIATMIGGALMGLIYSFLKVTLHANQNVTGLALTTFGTGIGNFFGGSLIKLVNTDIPSISLSDTSAVFKTQLPFANKLGWFGEIFLSYGFLVYVSIQRLFQQLISCSSWFAYQYF